MFVPRVSRAFGSRIKWHPLGKEDTRKGGRGKANVNKGAIQHALGRCLFSARPQRKGWLARTSRVLADGKPGEGGSRWWEGRSWL